LVNLILPSHPPILVAKLVCLSFESVSAKRSAFDQDLSHHALSIHYIFRTTPLDIYYIRPDIHIMQSHREESALHPLLHANKLTLSACPADTALSSSTYTHDFTTSGADNDAWEVTADNVTYTSSGAEFTITRAGDAPTIRSKWYIFFGRVSFFLQAAPGTGIVSSAILESDDLDELDWEWLGGTDYESKVQTNYFGAPLPSISISDTI
jgi:hypothetical protein